MNSKFLPWLLLFCALGLSGTAAYYSVYGLSIIFSGVSIPVIIMGSFLEISKISIATYLHDSWNKVYGVLKLYLTMALVTLSILTSIGIYGLLATGFQKSIAGLEINNKKIKNVEVKKQRFEEIKKEFQKEKKGLDKDITSLRTALSTSTTTQTVDRRSGQVVTKANNENRKAFQQQLSIAQQSRDTLSKKIDNLNDSITNLDIQILDISSKEIESGELGAIKYLSEITGWEVKKTANFFILTLIFVFDPLAIALVITTNQAFKKYRRKEEDDEIKPVIKEIFEEDEVEIPESYLTYDIIHDTIHDTPQVEPEIIERIIEVPVEVDRIVEIPVEVDRIVEIPVEVIKEVERIVEVPVDRIVEVVREVPVDRMVEIVREIPVEVIKEVEKIVEVPVEIEKIIHVPVDRVIEVPVNYYVKENGDILDQEGNMMDKVKLEKKNEESNRKVLSYKK
jgi:Skp family chaperone for outer membrane proteins